MAGSSRRLPRLPVFENSHDITNLPKPLGQAYEAQLDREIEQRRQQLIAAEALYRRELGTALAPEAAPLAQLDELEPASKRA